MQSQQQNQPIYSLRDEKAHFPAAAAVVGIVQASHSRSKSFPLPFPHSSFL
jgi:hypothetical protein